MLKNLGNITKWSSNHRPDLRASVELGECLIGAANYDEAFNARKKH